MARLYLTLPVLFVLLTGCTISAKANPATDPGLSSSPVATATVAPVLAPAEAAREQLVSVLGASRSSAVAGVTATEGALTVTLLTARSTLGGAEEYWTFCRALEPLLASGAITSVALAAPDGTPVVGASLPAPSCALLPAR